MPNVFVTISGRRRALGSWESLLLGSPVFHQYPSFLETYVMTPGYGLTPMPLDVGSFSSMA